MGALFSELGMETTQGRLAVRTCFPDWRGVCQRARGRETLRGEGRDRGPWADGGSARWAWPPLGDEDTRALGDGLTALRTFVDPRSAVHAHTDVPAAGVAVGRRVLARRGLGMAGGADEELGLLASEGDKADSARAA